MIREEDLLLKPAADALVVIRTTVLGREYRYCLQAFWKELHARTTAETVLPVEWVQLAVAEQAIRVFPLPLLLD